jgi:mediator of RNA polymerase II transcription subunit 16
MVRESKTGAWTVSKESRHPIQAPEGRRIKHIQFNGVGIDLAVVDSTGHLHIQTLTGALGKMVPANADLARDSTQHELNGVVGLHWLALYPAEFRVRT